MSELNFDDFWIQLKKEEETKIQTKNQEQTCYYCQKLIVQKEKCSNCGAPVNGRSNKWA